MSCADSIEGIPLLFLILQDENDIRSIAKTKTECLMMLVLIVQIKTQLNQVISQLTPAILYWTVIWRERDLWIIVQVSGFKPVFWNNSFTLTLSNSAILNNISNPGCVLLLHHFEMVEGSLHSCSASHLLVFFFSTKTTLIRFKSSLILNWNCLLRKDSDYFE